jgi:cobalamin biosynthesis protein CobT
MPGAAIEEEAEAVAGKHGEGEAKRENGTKTRHIVSCAPKRKVYEEPGSSSSGDDDEGLEENSEGEDVNVEEEDEGDAEDEEDDDEEGQTDLEEDEPVEVEEDDVDVEEDGSDSEDEEEEEEEEETPDTRHGKKQKADTTNTKVTTKAGKKAAPYRVFSSLDDLLGKGGGREKIIHKEGGGFAGDKRERGKG